MPVGKVHDRAVLRATPSRSSPINGAQGGAAGIAAAAPAAAALAAPATAAALAVATAEALLLLLLLPPLLLSGQPLRQRPSIPKPCGF